MMVTPVLTGPTPTLSGPCPLMSETCPTSTPGTSVIAFSGPGAPSNGTPMSRARSTDAVRPTGSSTALTRRTIGRANRALISPPLFTRQGPPVRSQDRPPLCAPYHLERIAPLIGLLQGMQVAG